MSGAGVDHVARKGPMRKSDFGTMQNVCHFEDWDTCLCRLERSSSLPFLPHSYPMACNKRMSSCVRSQNDWQDWQDLEFQGGSFEPPPSVLFPSDVSYCEQAERSGEEFRRWISSKDIFGAGVVFRSCDVATYVCNNSICWLWCNNLVGWASITGPSHLRPAW